jgi:phosphatidylglycerophosphate synthase
VAGKLKTALECVAIGAILVNGATGDEVPVIHGFTLASIWLMLVIVLYSGVSYTTRAVKLLNEIVAEERES